MATIIIGSYMVRYPLGGNLSWALQYLSGFKDLGHDVYMVEKSAYPNSCYNPVEQVQSDDCLYGIKVVSELLSRYGLEDKWSYVDADNVYHGLSKTKIDDIFKNADLYIESGAHGSWENEVSLVPLTVYIDVDPAYTQIRFDFASRHGIHLPAYDYYYTNGFNVGKEGNIIPTGGINWRHIFNPVNTRLFKRLKVPENAPYSTIMNWKSYDNVEYKGVLYGQKDIEFEKFVDLPKLIKAPLEVAVSGLDELKATTLRDKGWLINSAQRVTLSVDSFCEYLSGCRGEFSVCKNVYTATSSGWFSDKSAAYMASGRPVVLQETGFSKYLPVGEGLFSVSDVYDAKQAIESIETNYSKHCEKAWEIANEYLNTKKVLKNFLSELGL